MRNIYQELIGLYGHLYNRRYIPGVLLSPVRYSVRKIGNLIIPSFFKKSKSYIIQSNVQEKRTVISLTSFPKRINNVWIVIECLLRQTISPDMIVLWLSIEQFPNQYDDLPANLKNIQSDIVKIRFVEGDIRSHKKYYYAFKEYPNDYVITVDDDIFYPSYMIEELLRAKEKYGDAVIGRYCLVMKYRENGTPLAYNSWADDYEVNTLDAFLGTGGGTLFEPSKLYKDALNVELATKLAPLADDVWLNAMIRLAKLPIKIISKELLMPIITKRDQRLTQMNVYENKNDKQIDAVSKYYENTVGINPFIKEQQTL